MSGITITYEEVVQAITLSETAVTITFAETVATIGAGGATNLGYTASPTNGTVTSDTGTDATLPLGTGTNAGLLSPTQFAKLSNLSGTNTGDETAATLGATINGASAATPNNTDLVATVESSVVKKITWTNVKAFLKTYFDSLYPSGSGTSTGTNTGDNATNSQYSGLSASKLDATDGAITVTSPGVNSAGYLGIPQQSKSANYTTVLSDSGKHIYHPSTEANARTFTIDSNSNVAYPIGTTLTFINETSQVVTIAITSDTMVLAGTGSTGSRSLAQYGMATAVKVTATRWYINGNGLT